MKTWTIALKDTLVRFRDRNAILLMIAAPLLISLVMGAAFGGQGGDTSPIYEIPVVLVNADEGDLGESFVEILTRIEVETAEGAKPLFLATEMTDTSTADDPALSARLDAAKTLIEQGEVRGVVYLPPAFSDTLRAGMGEDAERGTATIAVFTDPTATVSPGIIRGVVSRIASGFSTVIIGNTIAVNQLLNYVTEIPVVFVNEDTGPLSDAVTEAFAPENFEELFVLTTANTLADAQAKLDAGEAQAIIHVTDKFSAAVMTGSNGEAVAETLDVFAAPGSLSAPIVEDIALSIARNFGSDADPNTETEPSVILTNLENLEDILNEENTKFGETESFAETEGPRDRITVSTGLVGEAEDVNLLNYFVPSMAIFFLMFAVFDGTQSILEEERDGTLHRMMTTPTGRAEIILGKIGGAFLTGTLQFVVLVVVSGLLFKVDWGSEPVGMSLLVLGTVAAATSLGAFIASFARTVAQAGVLGSAITLVSAILGGNFIDYRSIPSWLTPISKMTINRWAMEGFTNLTLGGMNLSGVTLNIAVLFGLAIVFFVLSLVLFNRRFVK
ncbi:MAG TPA: ABC transporter permease [Anaerolineales bacterium]|nr:ABC transporter permease [Anaerolineales bacterium]